MRQPDQIAPVLPLQGHDQPLRVRRGRDGVHGVTPVGDPVPSSHRCDHRSQARDTDSGVHTSSTGCSAGPANTRAVTSGKTPGSRSGVTPVARAVLDVHAPVVRPGQQGHGGVVLVVVELPEREAGRGGGQQDALFDALAALRPHPQLVAQITGRPVRAVAQESRVDPAESTVGPDHGERGACGGEASRDRVAHQPCRPSATLSRSVVPSGVPTRLSERAGVPASPPRGCPGARRSSGPRRAATAARTVRPPRPPPSRPPSAPRPRPSRSARRARVPWPEGTPDRPARGGRPGSGRATPGTAGAVLPGRR